MAPSPWLSLLTPSLAALAGVALGIFLERSRRAKGSRQSSRDVVNSGEDLRVERGELEAAVAACLEAAGAPKPKANLVARVLVAADCRGIPSHGVNRTEMYCGELRAGLINPDAMPRLSSETVSTANVDGLNGLGAVVSEFAMQLCIRKAKASGIGLVVCHNSNHFGIAGFWSELALKEGLIGFAFTNTSPFLVPTRACRRAGGTNPISCYCPGTRDSFQLDMATSTVPVGKIEVCHRKEQEIPPGWGVDRAGAPTNKPTEVLAGGGLTPVGGHEETAGYKGYGLNMMVEILCAVLSGCKDVGPDVPPWRVDRGRPVDYGHCFMCIDPEKILPEGEFQAKLSAYLARMRGLSAADAALPVLVPGDPESAEELAAEKHGVRLNIQVAQGLRNLSQDLGCLQTMPAPIRDLPQNVMAPRHPHTV
ncbi:Malate dehydrogenase [Symbiodinium microadriaticum]|uniref:Malate dehydrogenase n=1 Tax=Symbiodinium microadriaticum TaxID=2951 RepID=A0A1Q9CW37_SYMMI|nr:Malate dehydrogenase [Symbiodinium microadriaticum]